MISMKRYRRYLPVAISILLIGVLVAYAPWDEVVKIFSDLDGGVIALLVFLSLIYYTLKTVRFWYLLQSLDIEQPLKPVALSYMSAQPVTLLPAGELYRSHSLEKHTGVPVKLSLPQFTIQGLLEGAAMATLSIFSALALRTLRFPIISVAVLVLLCMIGISRGYIANFTHQINKLPFINLPERTIEQFSQRHKGPLSWQWLPLLYGISLVIEVVGATIAYVSVLGLGGHINGYQAILVYAIPIMLGFVSLLPGGFGISEQSAVGILLLSDLTVATAVASTILMRVTIVGLGALYGGVAFLFSRSYLKRTNLNLRQPKPDNSIKNS
jgi:uncharacterized protein (TIRG00374 family)